ncbi:MAG: DNA-directed RNA polymerase subunit N, partial [Thermoplasmata archaeon]|nr:DNA-directed RNA polymerase subunit N [Thermoplasmata archaeon]
VGSAYDEFVRRVDMGESPKEVLNSLHVDRYCCRRMILTHANLIDEVAPY